MIQFKNILVGIDARQPDAGTLNQAATLAEQHEAKIKLLDSVPEFSWLSKAFTPRHDDLLKMLVQETTERLEAVAVELGSKGFDVSICCRTGPQSEALIHEAHESSHDLVMRVAKGRNSRRGTFIGATGMRLLRKCPKPLWLTKPGETKPASRVMAAVDATPEDEDHGRLNERILNMATSVCPDRNNLHVVYAWEVFGETIFRAKMPEDEFAHLEKEFVRKNAASFQSLLSQQGLDPESPNVFMEHGDPVLKIPELLKAHQIDLLVMGSVARTGIPGMLMGNTAEALVQQIDCGLLTIKPDSFESPA